MATTKKIEPVKMTPTQMKKKIEALEEEIRVYKEDTAWCYMCGKPKKKNRENFYKNTDPLVKSGYAAICSECARKIALRTDENGEEHKPTKESIILALQYLNKPFLENVYTGKRKIVIAYDPARSRDNSVILVCEIYSEKNQDGDLEYKMRLLNCINLIDISNKKKKKPMQTPAQIEYLKQVILDYNQGGDENYSNILGVYIDAGSGGGGVNIADYLMPDWKDKSGKTHRGLIDKEYSEEYVKKFPNAVNKLHLMEPTKYKSEMYEAMIEMMNQDKIEFTATYDNKGYLTIFDIDKDKYEKTKKDLIAKYKKQKMTDEEIDYNVQKELDKLQNVKSHIEKLNWQEEASLSSIDALKEELVNMIRIPRQSGKDSFELCPEKANRLHDDRAYVTCMCSYALQTERRKNITAKRKPKVDKSLVQKLTIRKGVVHSMFET